MSTIRQSLQPRWLAVVLAASAGMTATTTSVPAQAAIDPATVIKVLGYLKQAYGYYKQYKQMLGGKAPTLAQQLNSLRADLVSDIRNQPLRSGTDAMIDLYTNLSDNNVGDPTNPSLFSNILTRQTELATAMSDIILNSNDPRSSYELAPAYNALIANGVAVLKIKGELWPDEPSSWRDYHNWLVKGIRTDYHMVASEYHECWDGTNPGWAGPMPGYPAILSWLARMEPGKYEDSQLYKYLMDKNFYTGVYDWEAWCSGGSHFVRTSGSGKGIWCNPVRDTCTNVCTAAILLGATRTSNQCASSLSTLECAHSLARSAFGQDPVVKIVREGMTGIMTLSGGNYSKKNTDFPLEGKYTDPKVPAPSCSRTWAYPQRP